MSCSPSAGIGAQERALRQFGLPYEIVNTCDLDKDAVLSYAAMRYNLEREIERFDFPSKEEMILKLQEKNVGLDFKTGKQTINDRTNIDKLKLYYLADHLSKNLGDISKVEKLPYADIVTYSFPCTDLSVAGKGEGMVNKCDACGYSSPIDFSSAEETLICPQCGEVISSSTRSGLLGQVQRLLGVAKENGTLPKYLVLENVKNLVGKKFIGQFEAWVKWLDSIGYNTHYKILNGKHYGIPQNRERVFAISIRKDVDTKGFIFPETIPLTTRLKDMLEQNVAKKFYLPDERIEKILNSTFMQEKKRIQMTDVCDTLLARDWKDPKCVPIEEPEVHQVMNVCPTKTRDNPNQGRVYDTNGIAPTLTKMDGGNREPFVIEQEPFIVASRGRNPENPSDRTTGAPTEQRLEPNFSGCTNTLTSVQKDNYVCQPIICEERKDEGIRLFKDDCVGTLRTIDACGDKRVIEPEVTEPSKIRWKIRKLTPLECWRLMNFTDEDHNRAAQYTSPSARYKMAGNSIIVSCLIAIFSSLFLEDGHKAEVWTEYILNFND